MLNHYHVIRRDGRLWIREESYDPAFEAKTESLFAQVNGRIGIRACFGLPSLYGKRETFYAGLFGRAFPEDVTELANCPDLTAFRLKISGKDLSPDSPYLEAFQREFSPETGELFICQDFRLPDGGLLRVKEHRFVSYAETELFLQEITLEMKEGSAAGAELVFAANGQVNNEGVSLFRKVECRVYERTVLGLEAQLPDRLLSAMCLNRVEEGSTNPPVFTLRRRRVEESRRFDLAEGKTLRLVRFCSYRTAASVGAEQEAQRKELLSSAEKGFGGLLAEHLSAMDELCRKSSLKITGADPEIETVLSLSRYHLLGTLPWNREDCGIASKGLTGEGYKGHVFWDTDLFIQPFFTWFFPEQSRHMLGFRVRGLSGAREKAEDYGYRGAMYPWEAAADGCEETPPFAALDIHTGKAMPVWSGRKEHHVGADIAYALDRKSVV